MTLNQNAIDEERVLKILIEHHRSLAYIAIHTEMSEKQARNALRRLQDKGFVFPEDNAWYARWNVIRARRKSYGQSKK